MAVFRWLGFLALLLPAGAGAFFALMLAGFSSMGFDSPQSDGKAWPYLLIVGSVVLALGSGYLVLNGARLMLAGRAKAAYACLVPPATLAGLIALWLARS